MTRLAMLLRSVPSVWNPRQVCGHMLASLCQGKTAIASFYPKRYASLSDQIASRNSNHSDHGQMHAFCCLFTSARFGPSPANAVKTGNRFGIQPLLVTRQVADWVSSFLKLSSTLNQFAMREWVLRSAVATARMR